MAGLAEGVRRWVAAGSWAEKQEGSPAARVGGQTWCRMEGRGLNMLIFRAGPKRDTLQTDKCGHL